MANGDTEITPSGGVAPEATPAANTSPAAATSTTPKNPQTSSSSIETSKEPPREHPKGLSEETPARRPSQESSKEPSKAKLGATGSAEGSFKDADSNDSGAGGDNVKVAEIKLRRQNSGSTDPRNILLHPCIVTLAFIVALWMQLRL